MLFAYANRQYANYDELVLTYEIGHSSISVIRYVQNTG